MAGSVAVHPLRRTLGPSLASVAAAAGPRSRAPWTLAGFGVALLCSGVAWASLPPSAPTLSDSDRQWQALGVQPIAGGGRTGLRMASGAAVEAVDFVPDRKIPFVAPRPRLESRNASSPPLPLRIRGRAGDGLYWALRSAGATPDIAAQYLAALADQIDVGADIAPGDRFDLILSHGTSPRLLYAGLDRSFAGPMKLVRWGDGSSARWIDAAREERPEAVETGFLLPAAGRITSTFGTRVHPILRFARFHSGIDIGASWGSPIVAAGDGQVVGAGWAGGYGRQVRIAHGNGTVSSYSHMSEMAVAPGTLVHRGQVIGYVGSSGLSTGPHLHFEIRQAGTAVNPLGATMISMPAVDPALAKRVKARLAELMKVGSRA